MRSNARLPSGEQVMRGGVSTTTRKVEEVLRLLGVGDAERLLPPLELLILIVLPFLTC